MNMRILDGEIITSRLDDIRVYDGVRTRRVMAFLADCLMVGLLSIPFAILVLLLGIITFGLGWALFGFLVPVVALTYVWFTLGGRDQATIGMKWMNIRLERLDGRPVDGVFALIYSILFWAGNAILTPLVLLITLFANRKRALHDLLLGTVVIRTDR